MYDFQQDFQPAGLPPDATEPNENDTPVPVPLYTKPFIFSSKKITALRVSCNQIIRGLNLVPEPTIRLSSNDVITALLGLCVSRAQMEDSSNQAVKSSSVTMSVNLRPRFQSLDGMESCIGNVTTTLREHFGHLSSPCAGGPDVVLPSIDGIKDDDLLYLAQKALHLRRKLSAVDDDYVHGLMAYLHERRGKGEDTCMVIPDIMVSSWSNLNTYSLDFGPELGKISNFEIQGDVLSGLVILLPVNQSAGSDAWDVRVTLTPEHMKRLSKDPLMIWGLE